MFKFLFHTLILASVVLLPLQVCAEVRTKLAEAYRTAEGVTFSDTPELKLYDALVTLCTAPESNTDLLRVIDAAHATETDPGLKPSLLALEALYYARLGEMTGYKKAVATLKRAPYTPELLSTVDVTDILQTCGTCRGRLTCKKCQDTLKCTTCKGKGTLSVRTTASSNATMLSESTSKKTTCTTCRGTKRCATCNGEPKSCATCNSTGKYPDAEKVALRIKSLAQTLRDIMHADVASDLLTREQTALLAEDLKRAEAMTRVEDALYVFESLPEERYHARQWSQAELCRTLLEALKDATSAETLERERQRTVLRTAIRDAQQASDPQKGLELLDTAIRRYADCDIVHEAKSAFDGLLLAYAHQQRLRLDHLIERKEMICSLQSSEERIRQIKATLDDWESLAPRPLNKKFRPYSLTDATVSSNETDAFKREFEALLEIDQTTSSPKILSEEAKVKAELEQLLAEIKAQQAATNDAETPWWVWVGAGLAGLLLLSGLTTFLQRVREHRAEMARRAHERAIHESIRNTFSHHRKQ